MYILHCKSKLMRYLFVILYVLLACIGTAFLCMGGTNKETNKQKLVDAEYVAQKKYLAHCIHKLPQNMQVLLDLHTQKWAKETENRIAHPNITKAYDFAKCLQILSRHQAEKLLCPSYEKNYKDKNHIWPYVLQNYSQCVTNSGDEVRHIMLYNGKRK